MLEVPLARRRLVNRVERAAVVMKIPPPPPQQFRFSGGFWGPASRGLLLLDLSLLLLVTNVLVDVLCC